MHILQGIALFCFFYQAALLGKGRLPVILRDVNKKERSCIRISNGSSWQPALEDCGHGFACRQHSILEEVVKESDIPVQRFYCRRRREDWRMEKGLARVA